MRVSVALASYNGEKFIQEQLLSIINQSHIPDEIVISDRNIKSFIDDKKDIYLNIHCVKKTGFLNIPKISIL